MEAKKFKYVVVNAAFISRGVYDQYVDASVSGLDQAEKNALVEKSALVDRYKLNFTVTGDTRGSHLKDHPLEVINALSQLLGYKVVSSAGAGPNCYMWTLQRELL